jgi:hypothetical protein
MRRRKAAGRRRKNEKEREENKHGSNITRPVKESKLTKGCQE